MQNLPMFNYNEPKSSVGSGARTTQVRFYPQGFSNFATGVGPNNYVKFDFRTTGFWDPKSSYMHIEVQPDVLNEQTQGTIWQVDNSAQSIFSQLIIRHNGIEIERNNEYDSMCAMLYDMNVGLGARDYQDLQGMGKNRNGYNQVFSNKGSSMFGTTKNWVNTQVTGLGGGWTGTSGAYQTPPTICTWRPYLCSQPASSNVDLPGLTANQSTAQLSKYHDLYMCDGCEGVQTEFVANSNQQIVTYSWNGFISLNTCNNGYTNPYSEACVGGGEPWMTSGLWSRLTISAGVPCMKKPQSLTFVIPIMSPIWGPSSTHGKLLPMRLFQGLEFEFQISPYLFTSHTVKDVGKYRTGNAFQNNANFYNGADTLADQAGVRGGWSIKSMMIVTEIMNLEENQEMNIINNIQTNGFHIPFEQWYLCQRVKYDGTQQLNTTLQINHAFESLKMLTIRGVPADFETYSWARKHVGISMNLTSLQLRVGNEYIPSTPITGHTGNIRSDIEGNVLRSNYVDFFIQTKKAWGKFFDMDDSTLLNPTNFTMNHTGYNLNMVPTTGDIFINSAMGNHLMWGQSLFHINRAIPRSMISLDTERFDLEPRVLSGLNTTQNRPFDLILQNDTGPLTFNAAQIRPNESTGTTATVATLSSTEFGRAFYLYVWAFYDAALIYDNGSWMVTGRH